MSDLCSTATIEDEPERTRELVDQLVDVWEQSVRATHLFLSDDEVAQIRPFVPQALEGVERLTVARDDAGEPIGFMGTAGARLEMLFLAPAARGQGLGAKLLRHAIDEAGIDELTVNEQNPQAVGFYEHMGFTTYRRTDLDEEGRPYPLLYMKR